MNISSGSVRAGAQRRLRVDQAGPHVWELTHHDRDGWPDWVAGVDERSLVIVDEAGLASTRNLDVLVGFVRDRGGRVLLVGDDRQRAAAGAGGVLRDIDAAHSSSTLVEVIRFTDPVEGQASLALRGGDTSASGYYADHQRLQPSPTTPRSTPSTPPGPRIGPPGTTRS